MPSFLGRDITVQQLNQLRRMAHEWRAESDAFNKNVERALMDRFRRTPAEVARVLERMEPDIAEVVRDMKSYKRRTKSTGDIDAMIKASSDAVAAVRSGAAAAAALAADEMSVSDAANALVRTYGMLMEHSTAERNFKINKALTNMVSDALADNETPPGSTVSIVDFSKSLEDAHKAGEYKELAARLPDASRTRTWTLVRLPVVPILGTRPKSADFKGFADVDPIVFQDAQGRVRSRYLVFREQLLMAASKKWIDRKIAHNQESIGRRTLDLRKQGDLSDFMQAEVDEMAAAAAAIPGSRSARRERLTGQRMVTELSASHRRAPGLVFFWLAPRRTADRVLAKVRRVRDWAPALP